MTHARHRQTCPPVQEHRAARGSAGMEWRWAQREASYWEAIVLWSFTWGSGVLGGDVGGFSFLSVPRPVSSAPRLDSASSPGSCLILSLPPSLS